MSKRIVSMALPQTFRDFLFECGKDEVASASNHTRRHYKSIKAVERLINKYKTIDPESFKEEYESITSDVLISRVRSCINNAKRKSRKKSRKIGHSASSTSPISTKPITSSITTISTINSSSPSTSVQFAPSTSPTTVSHALVQVTSSSNTPVIPSTITYQDVPPSKDETMA